MLKAIGKFIDTLPLRNLISLEEANADTVTIEVDRFHDSLDLADFIFIMRGVMPSGAETRSVLEKSLSEDGNYLYLTWHIGSLFTTEAGSLFLDLMAYQNNPESNQPEHLLRYQLPAVEVRDIPTGVGNASDGENYTNLWLDVNARLEAFQDTLGTQGDRIRSILSAVGEHTTVIEELKNRIEILVMSQEDYDALDSPDDRVLYVLT